ncbi:hypothetical protein [Colwellia piezophila]|uniref:hypothetical protein n=1 Tax=Colwellia piezophila TaxID=211668 RepID=UPI000371F750|nr:hypothetical protein [Colwellia piezophila]
MKYLTQLMCSFVLLTFSLSATAGVLPCESGSVYLTNVQLAADPSAFPSGDNDLVFLGDEYKGYTTCAGEFLGNDKFNPTGSNIGEYGNGWLNGQPQGKNEHNTDGRLFPNNTLFDPLYLDGLNGVPGDGDDSAGPYNHNLAFIDDPAHPQEGLQDWDDDGFATDPGWVYLGRDNGFTDEDEDGFDDVVGFEYATTGAGILVEAWDIGALLDITFSCSDSFDVYTALDDDCTSGWWSVMPDPDIASLLEPLFGEGVFDHLAIVFKSGDGFAVFDFNFNAITIGGQGLSLELPYNLAGTFDMSGVFQSDHGNPQGISHISVWARDPAFTTTEIPEPKSTMLMLFAVALLLLRFKSKHTL